MTSHKIAIGILQVIGLLLPVLLISLRLYLDSPVRDHEVDLPGGYPPNAGQVTKHVFYIVALLVLSAWLAAIRLLIEVGIYSLTSAALAVLGVALTMFGFIIRRIAQRHQLEEDI